MTAEKTKTYPLGFTPSRPKVGLYWKVMDIATITSTLNLLGLVVFGYLVKGLRERIENLTLLAKEQKETLEAVRVRATELDQLRKDYRQGLEDFQDLGKKLDERRAQLVVELEQANKVKDDELARLKTIQLEELELRKKSLERIPEIEKRLTDTVVELERQMSMISIRPSNAANLIRFFQSDPGSPLDTLLATFYHTVRNDLAHDFVVKRVPRRYVIGKPDTGTDEPKKKEDE